MLHIKFHGNRSNGSGEEDFWKVFNIYGRGGHLGYVTSIIKILFHCTLKLTYKIWLKMSHWFMRKARSFFICK